MNPTKLEDTIVKPEANETAPKQEEVILSQEELEKNISKITTEIDEAAVTVEGIGTETLSNPEIQGYSEFQEIKNLDEQLTWLKQNSLDKVAWIKDRFNLDKTPIENIRGFEVQGTEQFRREIETAIRFLGLAQEALEYSRQHVPRIQEWDRSAINMFKQQPTFEVGNIWKDGDAIYLASGIVHEAKHSQMCKESETHNGEVVLGAFIGKQAEKECIAIQIKALEEMKTSTWMKDHPDLQAIAQAHIESLESQVINPTHHNTPAAEQNW